MAQGAPGLPVMGLEQKGEEIIRRRRIGEPGLEDLFHDRAHVPQDGARLPPFDPRHPTGHAQKREKIGPHIDVQKIGDVPAQRGPVEGQPREQGVAQNIEGQAHHLVMDVEADLATALAPAREPLAAHRRHHRHQGLDALGVKGRLHGAALPGPAVPMGGQDTFAQGGFEDLPLDPRLWIEVGLGEHMAQALGIVQEQGVNHRRAIEKDLLLEGPARPHGQGVVSRFAKKMQEGGKTLFGMKARELAGTWSASVHGHLLHPPCLVRVENPGKPDPGTWD